ncbi:MAG: holo-ACP synthase [Thermodesulfobacteriota bacterium]|nr:MAG: holo-ACP synthase [Thermodesulfobacteriota bacterium]
MIYGIGIDIVDVHRFRAASERFGEGFLRRLFTDKELGYCMTKRFPERHLAARFAAKVSLFKAMGRSVRFTDVEVMRDEKGRPFFSVFPGEEGAFKFTLSLSHGKAFGIAETIVEKVL